MNQNIPSDLILILNSKAKQAAKEGRKVVNGTIGMMSLDDGSLPLNQLIRDTLGRHTEDNDLIYSSVAGEEGYRTKLLSWFFEDALKEAEKNGNACTVATMGGTGALALAFKDGASDTKAGILLPRLSWPNYYAQASLFTDQVAFYQNYDEKGGFHIRDVEEKIQSLLERKERLLLVVNDPCENPTGYCLSAEEWKALVDLLNAYHGKVRLILDSAYIDYAGAGTKKLIADSLLSLSPEVLTYICLSFSKTFSLYGLRIGALTLFSMDSSKSKAAFQAACKSARTLWSTGNHMAMNAVEDLLSREETVQELRKEVQRNREIVKNRAQIFCAEAESCSLSFYPYRFGFYLSLPCSDALSLSTQLMTKDIYLSPVASDVLRVALCCIPTPQVPGLARTIKEAEESLSSAQN